MKNLKTMIQAITKFIGLFNFWSWFFDAYEDYREWAIIKEVCKEKTTIEKFYSNTPQLRVDKIYRIYTVIEVPYDYSVNKTTAWTYVMGELRKIDELFISLGLGELVVPEIKQVGPVSWLVVLRPAFDDLNIKSFFFEILRWVFIYYFAIIANNLIAFSFDINIIEIVSIFINSFMESPFSPIK